MVSPSFYCLSWAANPQPATYDSIHQQATARAGVQAFAHLSHLSHRLLHLLLTNFSFIAASVISSSFSSSSTATPCRVHHGLSDFSPNQLPARDGPGKATKPRRPSERSGKAACRPSRSLL